MGKMEDKVWEKLRKVLVAYQLIWVIQMCNRKRLLIVIVLCFCIYIYVLWIYPSFLKNHENIYFSNHSYTYTYDENKVTFYNKGAEQEILLLSKKKIMDLCVSDINGDNEDEIIILSKEESADYGEDLIIYKVEYARNTIEVKRIYTSNLSTIHPFMIKTCDVDGDGIIEIFMGVYKKTPFYPIKENRPFFFNFLEGKLVKKWTGSKVRHSFIDACFVDFEGKGRDFFAVLETNNEGHRVALYYWLGFGFTLLGESEVYEKISDITTVNIDGKEYIKTTLYKNGIKKERLLQLTNKKNQNDLIALEERGF